MPATQADGAIRVERQPIRVEGVVNDAGKTMSFTPTTGQCVMFPGWQYHAVAPYLGKAPRISVAFNLDPILPQ